MRSIPINIFLKKLIAYTVFKVFIGLAVLGCSSTKKIQQTNLLYLNQNAAQIRTSNGNIATSAQDYNLNNPDHISQKLELATTMLDSLTQIISNTKKVDIVSQPILIEEFTNSDILDIKTPVAEKIVENYLLSENKKPSGHCLDVSKGRFEQAYKEVHGHLIYQDLPDSMATKLFTARQVYNILYDSASDTNQGWRSLPEQYRGKGNAGAVAYAGMGTLVDSLGIWSGKLRPGALMQVWRHKADYEKVVQGVNVKNLDSYGHSFIFISYVCNEQNEIIGLKIADQGFQSSNPLIPKNYEVWWAVNLNI